MHETVKPLRLKREVIAKASTKPTQASFAPVAGVLVDSGVLHLDQEFDFLVPYEFSETMVPGSLVKVPFRRKRVLGIVTTRKESSDFRGELRFVSELVRPFPLVPPNTLELCNEVRKYYGGTRWDVLRFALPALTKHEQPVANTKESQSQNPDGDYSSNATLDSTYPSSFWQTLSQPPSRQRHIRAYWAPLPAADPLLTIEKFLSRITGSALVVLPDYSDVERLWNLLMANPNVNPNVNSKRIVKWHSQMGRGDRERIFLDVLSEERVIVVGTRGSLFLPVKNLDAVILWDEASKNHAEQRAPYFHSREVAIFKANIEKSHLVIGGYSPSIQCASYIESGFLGVLDASNREILARSIAIKAIDNRNSPQDIGRFPSKAWQVIKKGLAEGPVLVQVPLRGYIQSLACNFCRNRALCSCGGKLILPQKGTVPECYLCGSVIHSWVCAYCRRRDLRNNQIGDERLVEELGKSFPNQTILFSNGDHRLSSIKNETSVVVATPGAEPTAESGYSAIVVLNSNLAIERATIDAEVDARNQWFALGTMLRPGGTLFIDADNSHRNIQELMRWNPIGASLRELAERRTLNLPPVVKTLEISGDYEAVSQVVRNLPDYVLVSRPKAKGGATGQGTALVRVLTGNPLPVINEILGRVISQSASGGPIARVKIDPIDI